MNKSRYLSWAVLLKKDSSLLDLIRNISLAIFLPIMFPLNVFSKTSSKFSFDIFQRETSVNVSRLYWDGVWVRNESYAVTNSFSNRKPKVKSFSFFGINCLTIPLEIKYRLLSIHPIFKKIDFFLSFIFSSLFEK